MLGMQGVKIRWTGAETHENSVEKKKRFDDIERLGRKLNPSLDREEPIRGRRGDVYLGQ